MDERQLFLEALELDSSESRAEFLHSTCANDLQLKDRVEKLLGFHESQDFPDEAPDLTIDDMKVVSLTHDWSSVDDPGSETLVSEQDLTDDGPIKFDWMPHSLEGYSIDGVLGHGGMGVVLSGLDLQLNRKVAVKVLSPTAIRMPHARQRFLREARAVATIDSPHVVTVYRVEDGESPFMVMEYIDGQDLQELLAKGLPELKESVRITLQIAKGLQASHACNVVHRDIKPANVFIQQSTQDVKIIDFGLARIESEGALTNVGQMAGTPHFMSPEQASGQEIDARSDLFSLGATLYAMIAGQSPFFADTTIAAIRKVCDQPHIPIRERNPDVPESLSRLIDRLLQKSPDDRIQSAAKLVEALAEIQDELANPKPAIAAVSERPLRKWWAWTVLALALFLVTSESAGFTHLSNFLIRLAVGEGTLAIEVFDPTVKVNVLGPNDVRIRWNGNDLQLSPGDYQVTATRDGESVKQEIVSITRDKTRVFTVTLESPPIKSVDKTRQTDSLLTGIKDPIGWKGWPQDAPPPATIPFSQERATELQNAWANYLRVPVEFENSLGIPFRLIPPGEYMMGISDSDYETFMSARSEPQGIFVGSRPQHPVRITKPFYMAIWEVRYKDFDEVVGRSLAAGEDLNKVAPEATEDWPVFQFCSWNEAIEFCNSLSEREGKTPCYVISEDGVELNPDGNGYRLPTEAEWEFACRGGTDTVYFHGAPVRKVVDFLNDEQDPELSPWMQNIFRKWVGIFPGQLIGVGGANDIDTQPNPFGLYQMYWGATEHCWDWQNPEYFASLPVDTFTHDPLGPENGRVHVVRGTSIFGAQLYSSNSVARGRSFSPDKDSFHTGLGRLVLPVESVQRKSTNSPKPIQQQTHATIVIDNRPEWQGWPADGPEPAIVPFDSEKALQLQEAWAQYLNVPVEFKNSCGIRFRLIPPGEAKIGISDEDYQRILEAMGPLAEHEGPRFTQVHPQHAIRITEPYYIGTWEILFVDYEAVTGQDLYGMLHTPDSRIRRESFVGSRLCWNDMVQFCIKLNNREGLPETYLVNENATIWNREQFGYRLATEAEWEFACRGGSADPWFPAEVNVEEVCKSLQEDGRGSIELLSKYKGGTHDMTYAERVENLVPNPFGLHGMYKGSIETCWDWMTPDYFRSMAGRDIVNDPTGADHGSHHVTRGGSAHGRVIWSTNSVARGFGCPPDIAGAYTGFGRVVLSVEGVKRLLESGKVELHRE